MFAKTRVHLVLVLLVAVASLSLASKHNKDKYDKPTAQPVATAEAIAELLASADNQSATSASVYYDQRQTGKYNINVNIKDVAIISIDPESLAGNVGDSSTDGDYYEDYYDYDMDDFTVSPIAALLGGMTTKKPKPSPSPSPPSPTPAIAANASSSTAASAPTSAPTIVLATNTSSSAASAEPVYISSTATTEAKPQPQLPQLQENEIPVHVVMDGEQLPQHFGGGGGGGGGVRRRSNQQQQQQKQQHQRRRYRPVRRNNSYRNHPQALRCARGQPRDENGRCQPQGVAGAAAANGHGRRVGMQKVMDLLTLLTPNARE